jgi:hypothetical protein
MSDYGVFNDAGLMESDFASQEAADEALATYRAEEIAEGGDPATWFAGPICIQHEWHPAKDCPVCAEEAAGYEPDAYEEEL